MEEKLRECFSEMVVFKNLKTSNFFASLSLPSFLRDWLLKKFSDDEGHVDVEEVAEFVRTYLPRKEEWISIKNRIVYENERVQILTKISIDIDIKTGDISFSLPDFGLSTKETIIESHVWEEYKDELVNGKEIWGVVELGYRMPDDLAKPKIPGKIKLTGFTNFCPYTVDLDYYKDARNEFTVSEWITSAFEHHAVLHACASIERLGYPVAYLWPTSVGVVTSDILESCITLRTRLVSIMFANNEIGTIQPVQELSRVAHTYGASFHTDAVQAVGHVPINVHELGIDYLSASAHKFNGPHGIGFLYLREGASLPPFLDGGAQEKGKRAGTENVAAAVAMAVALKKNCDSMEENAVKLSSLEAALLNRLRATHIPFVKNGAGEHLPGVIGKSSSGSLRCRCFSKGKCRDY